MAQAVGHVTVLRDEAIEQLAVKPGGVYIDVTLGGGGHTRTLLEKYPDITVIGCDWDKTVIETTGQKLQEEFKDRFVPVWGNFARLDRMMKKINVTTVDGVLADFGTSQIQIFDTPGLSLYKDAFLDMRMSTGHFKTTAYDVLKNASEKTLADIFYEYGQDRYSRKIARAVVEYRKKKPLKTTIELAELVKSVVPYNAKKRIHPATQVFQALRIYVNKELENIQAFLVNATKLLAPCGRLVCITFHSLEDRLVKDFFRQQARNFDQKLDILTKKPIVPSEEEVQHNRSARSAKLRVAQKAERD